MNPGGGGLSGELMVNSEKGTPRSALKVSAIACRRAIADSGVVGVAVSGVEDMAPGVGFRGRNCSTYCVLLNEMMKSGQQQAGL